MLDSQTNENSDDTSIRISFKFHIDHNRSMKISCQINGAPPILTETLQPVDNIIIWVCLRVPFNQYQFSYYKLYAMEWKQLKIEIKTK